MKTYSSTLDHLFTSSAMIPNCNPHDLLGGIQLVEQLTKNAHLIQDMVLDEILKRNSETEYLHGFLKGERDKDLFREQVPIVDYDKVKPYIVRIANGENSNIISGKPIVELLTSSGTSGGQPKLMPSTEEELDRKTFMYNILIPVINKYVKGLEKGKGMYLLFIKPEITTPSGLICRPVLTSYYKSWHFRQRPFNLYNKYTSPDAAILCSDNCQSLYTQLLCGLIQRDEVLRVGAIFASAFLRAITFLEDHWQELCYDIRTGDFSSRVTDTSCIELVLGKILTGPNAELADKIESTCKKHPWEGIVKRLWPKTKFIEVIVTGSMMQYVPLLEFYGGGLPLVSTMYASSECFFGINLRPLDKPCDVAYTLLPNMCYYEFIRVKEEEDGVSGRDGNTIAAARVEEVVPLVDVELGCYYELIVTTFTGLYRYRVGDILKVTGFYNAAPQFKFVRRRDVVLSIDTDKTTEEDLLKSISATKPLLSQLSLFLSDFTSFPDTSSLPGHYVLFWELTPSTCTGTCKELENLLDPKVLDECCAVVESGLDSIYRRGRSRDRSIGPLEIRVVGNGAFDALMDFCLSRGSSVNQYKTPRCINSGDAVSVLDEKVIGKFFSQKAPHWDS
ncbi:indole-3-acetic acid-amido synthetase GH3.17-like [Carex rostrata]